MILLLAPAVVLCAFAYRLRVWNDKPAARPYTAAVGLFGATLLLILPTPPAVAVDRMIQDETGWANVPELAGDMCLVWGCACLAMFAIRASGLRVHPATAPVWSGAVSAVMLVVWAVSSAAHERAWSMLTIDGPILDVYWLLFLLPVGATQVVLVTLVAQVLPTTRRGPSRTAFRMIGASSLIALLGCAATAGIALPTPPGIGHTPDYALAAFAFVAASASITTFAFCGLPHACRCTRAQAPSDESRSEAA